MWHAASLVYPLATPPPLTALLKNKAMSSTETTVTKTELFDACKRGNLAKVRRAVAEGLEVKNAVDNGLFNYTPLHYASLYESLLCK